MKNPTNISEALALIEDIGKATLHGPLPQATVTALWHAASILAAELKKRPIAGPNPAYDGGCPH